LRDFLDKILQNVIANLIAAGVIAGLGIAIVLLRKEGVALTISVSINILLIGACFWLLVSKVKKEKPKQKQAVSQILTAKQDEVPEQKSEVAQTAAVPKYNLLPDPKKMTELNLDNPFLTEVYGKLYALALKWSEDARLMSFSVHVHPYKSYSYKVAIHLEFFSSWAKQSRTWVFDDQGEISEVGLPKHTTEEISTFGELPWMQYPDWLKMVQKAYVQVGQLPEVESTNCRVQTSASLGQWLFIFQDGVSGKEHKFKWTIEKGLRQY
jgi:hypothetical protein